MEVNKIAVIGAGTMGHGIAQLFAVAGFQVALHDNDASVLESAIPRIQANLETCLDHNLFDADVAAAGFSLPLPEVIGQLLDRVVQDISCRKILLHLNQAAAHLDVNSPTNANRRLQVCGTHVFSRKRERCRQD